MSSYARRCMFSGISRQRAYVGLEVSCGDYRDDAHMFQLTKAWDTVQYIKRTQVRILMLTVGLLNDHHLELMVKSEKSICLGFGYK